MSKNGDYGISDFIAKLDYLKLCGEDAARWLAEFSAEETICHARDIFKALALFRTHEIDGALALLDQVDRQLRAGPAGSISIRHLLRRWHYSAVAYYDYLTEDMDGARDALQKAFDEIRAALLLDPFLLPLATHCIDFHIQLARISRRENRWTEVQQQINTLRMIYANDSPFCVLDSGRPIYLSDLRQFFLSLPLSDEQKKSMRYALDANYDHDEWIDRLEENVYTLPELVIPYP